MAQKKCKQCGSLFLAIGGGDCCCIKCWHEYLFKQRIGGLFGEAQNKTRN